MVHAYEKFISKLLTGEQKNCLIEIAQYNLEVINNDENLLKKVITGDELWVYSYDVGN